MILSLFSFIAAHCVLFLVIAYTSTTNWLVRTVATATILVLCLISVRNSLVNSLVGGAGNDYVIGFVLHASMIMNIVQISPAEPNSTPLPRARWAFVQLFSARFNSRALPPWSNDPKQNRPPGKTQFLLAKLIDVSLCSLLVWLINTHYIKVYWSDYVEVDSGFLRRLLRPDGVDAREVMLRVVKSFFAHFTPYLGLRIGHAVSALIAVGLAADEPRNWPPLFGSISEAYTVRRYYSHFWHHLMRKAFTTHAAVIVNKMFRVKADTEVSRYSIMALAFYISATMHVLTAPFEPLKCTISNNLFFYTAVIGGVVMEDLVIRAYKKINWSQRVVKQNSKWRVSRTGWSRKEDNDRNIAHRKKTDEKIPLGGSKSSKAKILLGWRLLGFLWTFLFMTWATSKQFWGMNKCIYESMRRLM